MNVKTVNLYKNFAVSAPDGARAELTCYLQTCPPAVSPSRRRPAILILPGGGYGHTSPRESDPVALRFAARGWAAYVLHYSCAPLTFPTALREAAMAMRYIRETAAETEVDPGKVAAMGFSAGGHLCGCLGTLYDSAEVSDIGSSDVLRPDALGLCYPVAVSWGRTHNGSFENLTGNDEALRRRLSLETLVRPDMPPVFLWHTRDDGTVPVRNSLLLANALEENGIDFAMHIYRHGPHGLSTADSMAYPAAKVPETSWDVPGWLDAEIRFFTEIGLKIEDYEVET